MTEKPDRLSRMLRLWGKIGFFFFLAWALILAAIMLIEGQFTLRALLVIGAVAALGLIALKVAQIYEWIAHKLFPER